MVDTDVQGLILQKLNEINDEFKGVNLRLLQINDNMHQGTRRMDAYEREIELLRMADAKTETTVKAQGEMLTKLEPVLEVSNNVKRLIFAAIALAIFAIVWPNIPMNTGLAGKLEGKK